MEKVEEVAHSMVGPSSADRWMNCTGSNQLIAKIPPEERDKSGWAADEGTAAHYVGEQCLLNNQEAWEWADEIVRVGNREFRVDAEMIEGVQSYLDLIRDLLEKYADDGAELIIEKGVGSVFDDEAFGTIDARIVVPGLQLLIIVDLKYGRGIVREPNDEQLAIYGYYGVENWPYPDNPVTDVELWISQPRIPHPKGTNRRHIATADELTAYFTEEVLPKMRETREPDALLVVGDWCRFCPARKHCPARHKEVMEFSADTEPVDMTSDELAEALAKKKTLMKFFEDAEAEVMRRLRTGETVRGFKLVYKQTNRVFKESMRVGKGDNAKEVNFADAVVEAFGEEAYMPRQFKTPPNIEKLEGGAKFVATWAYKPSAGLTVAPENDKRKAVQLTKEEMYAGLSEET